MRLIGLVGFAGSGKGTAGDILVNEYSFVKDSFAAPLKDMLAAMFVWPRHLLEGDTDESREWREKVDPWWSDKLGIHEFSPRKAMQLIGTDTLRSHFNNNIWISSLERRLMLREGKKVVVTDCRFPNELDLLKRLGGIVVRIKRGTEPEWFDLAKEDNEFITSNLSEYNTVLNMTQLYPTIHQSEWAWIGYPMDMTIENIDGNIEALHDAVKQLVS